MVYKASSLGGRITDSVVSSSRIGFPTTDYVFASAVTLTTSQLKGGYITHDNIDNVDRTVTVPDVVDLEAAYEDLEVGFTLPLFVDNKAANIVTMAPGAGVTPSGNMVVGATNNATFWMRREGGTSWNIVRVS